MKKINFKEFEVYTNIKHDNCIIQDMREQIANLIYLNGAGVSAASIATRIYESEDNIELKDEEIAMLYKLFNDLKCTPVFVDSFKLNLKEIEDGNN